MTITRTRSRRQCDACASQGIPHQIYRKDRSDSMERKVNPKQARYGCSAGHEWIEELMLSNVWHVAICEQLHAAGGSLHVEQIWQGMASSGFTHGSKKPRQTLGARVAELVQKQKLMPVGPATYRLAQESTMQEPLMETAS